MTLDEAVAQAYRDQDEAAARVKHAARGQWLAGFWVGAAAMALWGVILWL